MYSSLLKATGNLLVTFETCYMDKNGKVVRVDYRLLSIYVTSYYSYHAKFKQSNFVGKFR